MSSAALNAEVSFDAKPARSQCDRRMQMIRELEQYLWVHWFRRLDAKRLSDPRRSTLAKDAVQPNSSHPELHRPTVRRR